MSMFDYSDEKPDYFVGDSRDKASGAAPDAGSTLDFGDGDDSGGSHGYPDEAPRRRRGRARRVVAWIIAVCVVVLVALCYFRYFNPYATESRIDGYVVNVERRGLLFKTYEAEIISESALTDTTRVYSRTLTVSIPSATLAHRLQAMQGSGRRVSLVTERFYGMLPWRGASTTVVTGIAD
ncbi:MAG: hypothetical protein K2K40_04535 [Paramuribaculum sp.]|nr:hypothetical protein [Paramuribaculum sp.]